MNPESGRRFGPYEIQSRLGGGGMGHVFRAWDARLHREVAIKLLNHEYAMPGMRERFLREARAASALNHPNICTVFDIGEQDGDPYLVMELLQGETLRNRILHQSIQLDEIISVARDAAEALGAAHSKGVVHRDVKPANIFLVDKPNGGKQAKVLDFGLAKIDGGALGARGRSLDLTTIGATVGTLAYMSPEQARGETLDSRSDLFSLGVVMYEMATRQVPFQGATSALVFVQLLNHAPDPVRQWNSAIPRELEKIITKLLAKERTGRYQTARELELALTALAGKGSGAGWLRKAVSTVPLIGAQDSFAREKRLSRPRISTDHGLQSPAPRPVTPFPDETVAPKPEGVTPSVGPEQQILRPVLRVPRSDATPTPARSSVLSSRDHSAATAKVRRVATPRLPSDAPSGSIPSGSLTPSQRVAIARLNAVPADSGTSTSRAATPSSQAIPKSPRVAGGDAPEPAPTPIVHPVDFRVIPENISLNEEAQSSPELDEAFPPLMEPAGPRVPKKLPFRPLWLGLSGLVVFMTALLLLIYNNRARFTSTPLNSSDVVVLAEIQNRTGNKSLDDSITEALSMELVQSRYFTLRSGESYRAARQLILLAAPQNASGNGMIIARKTAERLGARAYIFGTMSGTSPLYTLHIDLRDTSSNEVLASAEAHPESLQQVPGSIEQVATDLRVAVGESRLSVDATSTQLSGEASSNLAALQFYAEAESLISSRQPVDALNDLQQAVALDPKFIQAHLQLAILYQQLHAEIAAADSARLAFAASAKAGERTQTLTRAVFDREVSGDYPHETVLLRHLITLYPHDAAALTLLAESLRLQGHMADALSFAQQAYTEDPFNAAAYTQAETALIGLDRYDSAYQLDLQAQRLKLSRSGDALAAADLVGRNDVVTDLVASLPVGKIEYRPDWPYGIYLDNAGRLAAGAALWQSRAAAADQNDSLKSAATFLLAQGALNRAILGECAASLGMLPDPDPAGALLAGRTALFNIAVASALCGNRVRAEQSAAELRQLYPQSFEVNGYFLADIQAAEDLYEHQPAAALNDLVAARAFDLISITPLLRGQAHVAEHEAALGIVDFQTELAHPGVTYIIGDDVYPAAQIGVARAFADSGDVGNSAEAYQKFLFLWKNADPGIGFLIEADRHARL